jgi:hypothetical protein
VYQPPQSAAITLYEKPSQSAAKICQGWEWKEEIDFLLLGGYDVETTREFQQIVACEPAFGRFLGHF